MAIIIQDYEPSGDTIEVILPGSKKRWSIPNAETLTIKQMSAAQRGDLGFVYDLFPEEAHPLLDNLHAKQIEQLLKGWTKESGVVRNRCRHPANAGTPTADASRTCSR